MAEQIWYYARGDVEKGPVTGAQIKALAGAGKIRQDDFVWKEGMDTWVPAGELKELFPEGAQDVQESGVQKPIKRKPVTKTKPELTTRQASNTEKLVRPIGHLSLTVGLLTVLLARGCDTLSAHHAARLEAIIKSNVEQFDEDGLSRRQSLEQRRSELQSRTNSSPAAQQQLNEVNSRLDQLKGVIANERRQLEEGLWGQQRSAADRAKTNHLLWGFWREAAFLLGTVVLVIGLLAVAVSGDVPEKWLCLGMLGAIIFSVYLGNAVFLP